jgi:3-hydroxybutyryl-CoA dehydrogenase
VLATNTSSIPVVEIASAAARPENVAGMHFFNPAPLMRLVEVIAAPQTSDRALALTRATGEAMGKRVILAQDGPGFLVNRCGRPFYTEALRLLQERLATHEQVDRICRLGAGFRMGPFELMDLVGIDIGYAVAKSFTELSFGEPRWKPNPIQARMAAAGRLGRKTGRGYYDYSGGPHRPEDPEPPEPGGGEGREVVIGGSGAVADSLRDRARAAGFSVNTFEEFDWMAADPELVVEANPLRPTTELRLVGGRPSFEPPWILRLCTEASLAERGSAPDVGYHVLPGGCRLAELTRLRTTPDAAADAADAFFASLGYHREWVGDAPGLVLGRIVCGLVNEAAFAIGEGVGSPADVDAGLELGLNHPRGAVAWSELLGADAVAATIDGLHDHYREERYRLAPLLRSAAMTGASLRD